MQQDRDVPGTFSRERERWMRGARAFLFGARVNMHNAAKNEHRRCNRIERRT